MRKKLDGVPCGCRLLNVESGRMAGECLWHDDLRTQLKIEKHQCETLRWKIKELDQRAAESRGVVKQLAAKVAEIKALRRVVVAFTSLMNGDGDNAVPTNVNGCGSF